MSADEINQGNWREERRLSFPRDEESSRNASARNRQKAQTFGRFSVRAQPPGAKMAVREESVAWGKGAVKAYSTYSGLVFHTPNCWTKAVPLRALAVPG